MKNKGITLVALVITIILLLILAGISISQLSGSGLFENAKLAEEKSKNAQEKEESILSDYENQISAQLTSSSRENAAIEALRQEIEKLKPVELYSRSSGITGNFTLNQSIDDFKTIEIIYRLSSSTNGAANHYMKATPSELKSGVALNAFSYSAPKDKYIQLFSCKLTINGINAVRSTTTYAYNAGLSAGLSTVSSTGNISVVRVNGYYY